MKFVIQLEFEIEVPGRHPLNLPVENLVYQGLNGCMRTADVIVRDVTFNAQRKRDDIELPHLTSLYPETPR